MTLQTRLERFAAALAELGANLYHYHRPQMTFPCIVWQEDGISKLSTDNTTAEFAASGTLDYFSQQEFDPKVDDIQALFGRLGLCWELLSVQFEPETLLIHWEWSWEI